MEEMDVNYYLNKILGYLKENFENGEISSEQLSDEIRNKLMLMEDEEDRREFVNLILDELQEMSLIKKYGQVYGYNTGWYPEVINIPNMINDITYTFKRML